MAVIFRKYGIFFLIPGIVFVFSFILKASAGPYWLSLNLDPSYQYLVNGVYLLKGMVPNHTDHPGTPLQILCALVFRLVNCGHPAQDAVLQVLRNPEFYLHIVFACLAWFSFLTSVAVAVYVFHKTNDTLAGILSQLPLLSFLVLPSWVAPYPVLPVVANVCPEPLLIGVLNLFNICFLMNYFAATPKEAFISTIWWGLVCGLGAAVKLTFAPLVAVPLMVLSWKNKGVFAGIFVVSFIAWTLPILAKYPAMWGWISGLVTHTGIHGSGGRGIVDFANFWENCKDIVADKLVFAGMLLASLLLAFWKMAAGKWDRACFFLLACGLGILLQFAAVAKHPGAHYLLPGLGAFGALTVLVYLQCPYSRMGSRRLTLGLIVVFVLSGLWQASGYCVKLEGITRQILTFHKQMEAKYKNCIFIDYYRSSDPAAALFFGDGWNLSPHLGAELFSLYPDKYYLQIWGKRILNFNDRVWANDLLAQNSCVLFRGESGFDFSKGPYDVQLVNKGRFESIHGLSATSEKEAAMLLAACVRYLQSGDYAKALMCALGARKFHYQPDETVETLIKLCESKIQS